MGMRYVLMVLGYIKIVVDCRGLKFSMVRIVKYGGLVW